MAAVPSVVWGLFGLLVLAPFIDRVLISDDLASRYAPVVPLRGQSILLGILVLICMTVPFQIAIFTDALRAVPARVARRRTRARPRRLAGDAENLASRHPPRHRDRGRARDRASDRRGDRPLDDDRASSRSCPNPLDGLVFFLEPARPLASAIVDFHEGVDQGALAADLFSFAALILVSALALMLAVRLALAPVRARRSPVMTRVPRPRSASHLPGGAGLRSSARVGGLIGWLVWDGRRSASASRS